MSSVRWGGKWGENERGAESAGKSPPPGWRAAQGPGVDGLIDERKYVICFLKFDGFVEMFAIYLGVHRIITPSQKLLML